MARKEPAIVAELGRPETPEETAARKAETSRVHRQSQTLVALIGATVASLAIVLFLVAVVVRPSPPPAEEIDYAAIAQDAGESLSQPLLAPVLPPGWAANRARITTVAKIPTWYIGFITPDTQFIALNEGIGANPSWQSAILNDATSTGTLNIAGIDWTVFDRRDDRNAGNFAYSLATESGDVTIVLHGTAGDQDFETLATVIASDLEAR